MNLRSMVLSIVAVSASLLAMSVHAHDPSLHEKSDAHATSKAKPVTCAQLADSQRYSNDLADPDIKALKDRCDAGKKAAAKAAAGKKS